MQNKNNKNSTFVISDKLINHYVNENGERMQEATVAIPFKEVTSGYLILPVEERMIKPLKNGAQGVKLVILGEEHATRLARVENKITPTVSDWKEYIVTNDFIVSLVNSSYREYKMRRDRMNNTNADGGMEM